MQRSDIISKLKEGTVYITFLKADGATRDMKATLSESIAQYSDPASTIRAPKTATTTQAVWDETVNGWRSFRWDSVRSVDGLDTPNGIKS